MVCFFWSWPYEAFDELLLRLANIRDIFESWSLILMSCIVRTSLSAPVITGEADVATGDSALPLIMLSLRSSKSFCNLSIFSYIAWIWVFLAELIGDTCSTGGELIECILFIYLAAGNSWFNFKDSISAQSSCMLSSASHDLFSRRSIFSISYLTSFCKSLNSGIYTWVLTGSGAWTTVSGLADA